MEEKTQASLFFAFKPCEKCLQRIFKIYIYVVYLDYLFLCARHLDAPAVWWKKDWCLYEMREREEIKG